VAGELAWCLRPLQDSNRNRERILFYGGIRYASVFGVLFGKHRVLAF
jgi:hypothetical protein